MSESVEKAVDRLVRAAESARERARAPYSDFAVGAAVIDDLGRIHVGCNVENASYGLSVCAERHAVAAAVVAGAGEIKGLAVVTGTAPPVSPCGACRQVLAEFGDFPVILANFDGDRVETSVAELLPMAFTPASLDTGEE